MRGKEQRVGISGHEIIPVRLVKCDELIQNPFSKEFFYS